VSLLAQVFDKMQLLRIQTTKNNPNVLEIRTEHRQIYKPVRASPTAVSGNQEHLISKGGNPRVQQLQHPVETAVEERASLIY